MVSYRIPIGFLSDSYNVPVGFLWFPIRFLCFRIGFLCFPIGFRASEKSKFSVALRAIFFGMIMPLWIPRFGKSKKSVQGVILSRNGSKGYRPEGCTGLGDPRERPPSTRMRKKKERGHQKKEEARKKERARGTRVQEGFEHARGQRPGELIFIIL